MSHIYIKDPDTGTWRPVARRDGLLEAVTLWQHRAERSRARETGRRPIEEKTAIRREIAATVDASATKKQRLKEIARARHATNAPKPYQSLTSSPTPIRETPDPERPRRVFPVEDW